MTGAVTSGVGVGAGVGVASGSASPQAATPASTTVPTSKLATTDCRRDCVQAPKMRLTYRSPRQTLVEPYRARAVASSESRFTKGAVIILRIDVENAR